MRRQGGKTLVGAGHVPLRILDGKLQLILGRGGRGARVSCLKMLRLKLMNLCVFELFLLHKYIEKIGYAHHYNDLE